MTIQEKINRAIALEREMKDKKRQLDAVKAELTSELYTDMLNKNLKWKREAASGGSCSVALKSRLEIDDIALLRTLLGDMLANKVTEKETVEYEVSAPFKKALIALYRDDYAAGDIEAALIQLGLTDKERKAVLKKLSGDYDKDLALLHSYGVPGALEEELDLIHGQKNYELVSRYFDPDAIDAEFLKKLRLALYVEETLGITLSAQESAGGTEVGGETA